MPVIVRAANVFAPLMLGLAPVNTTVPKDKPPPAKVPPAPVMFMVDDEELNVKFVVVAVVHAVETDVSVIVLLVIVSVRVMEPLAFRVVPDSVCVLVSNVPAVKIRSENVRLSCNCHVPPAPLKVMSPIVFPAVVI